MTEQMPFIRQSQTTPHLPFMSLPSIGSQPPIARPCNLPFVINDYLFTQVIGKGGFAEVYLVRSTKFDTEFVAKVMTVDSSEKEKMWSVFDAECSALSSLNHPHVIRIYDRFHVNSQFFCILEYCPGGSLHDEINECGVFSLDKFMVIGGQIVSALQYCHSKGISHRDIKPRNILFDANKRAKLADFGLSLRTSAGKLQKAFSGSCSFTAPEIFLHKPHDPMAADIWALGVVFAMMISGSSPWKCNSIGALRQLQQSGQYSLSKGVPSVVSDLISRMIVVDPKSRITANELAQHPLFTQGNARKSLPSVPSSPFIKMKWDPIQRSDPDSDFPFEGNPEIRAFEEEPRMKLAKLNTASSSLLHTIPTSKRPKRSSVRPMLRETFCEEPFKELPDCFN